MNEGVEVSCKSVMEQVFTLVDLIVKLSTSISKSKVWIEVFPSIRQPSVTVTSNSNVNTVLTL